MDSWQRSQHLSWFGRQDAVYLYHDLFGYLLEMSADLKAFVDYFAEPHTAHEALVAFDGQLTQPQISQFMGVFVQQRVLVAPNAQELDALVDSVPIKGPFILTYREDDGRITALYSRGFGHESYAQPQQLQLDDWQSDLWRSIDGERTVRDLAMALTERYDGDVAMDLGRAVVSIAAWTHASRQLTRTLTAPRSQLQRLPTYATSTMPYAPLGQPQAENPQARDLTSYHQHTIADAEAQFEELETTLSHLFCDPHPALQGRTYAQSLVKAALDRGWVGPATQRVVEVGGGTGRFAAATVAELSKICADLHYTVVELSPALHAAQVQRLAPWADKAQSVLGHAEHLELPDASVDCLISNEVIADFRMGFVTRAALQAGQPDEATDPEAWRMVGHYGLVTARGPGPTEWESPALEPVPIQVGATRFVEQIARALRPGGVALLTEFGEENQFPIESTHLDHAEWSVHFGHLMQVARRLGLIATLEPVPDLLGLQGDVWVMASNRTQFRNLRHFLRSRGADLTKRALTPEQFAQACGGRVRADRFEGVQFRPVAERAMGLVPSEFKALVLRRPT